MKISLHRPGTRVRIRRGAAPLDPAWVGRTGLILASEDYRAGRYRVSLEGEATVSSFAEDELEPMADR